MLNDFYKKILAGRQAVLVYLMLSLAMVAHASDLAIYQPALQGTQTMIMMIDTSGSMGDGNGYGNSYASVSSIINDFGATDCSTSTQRGSSSTPGSPLSNTLYVAAVAGSAPVTDSSGAITTPGVQALPAYTLSFCPAQNATVGAKCQVSAVTLNSSFLGTLSTVSAGGTAMTAAQRATATAGGTGTFCFDRLSRVKLGMMATLADNSLAVQTTIMGLGNFSGHASGSNADGTTGEIMVPAVLLGPTSNYTSKAVYATPNPLLISGQRYQLAVAIATLSAYNGTPTANAYAEAAAYMLGTTTATASVSGFSNSTSYNTTYGANNTKILNAANNAYASPITANTATSCGQGIYFLSDGEPNGSSSANAQQAMKLALGTKGSVFACPTDTSAVTITGPGTAGSTAPTLSPASTSGGTASGWECMGNFALALNNNNPLFTSTKTVPIKTAFVAFGVDLASFTPGSTPPSPVGYYYDALNSCKWGSRPTGTPGANDLCAANVPPILKTYSANPQGGYGAGGYYVTASPTDVTNSIKDFIQGLATSTVPPLTTGAPSIPVDNLNPNGFEPFAYLRGLSPNPAASGAATWNGNLKKYNVDTNGVIVDANSVKVFTKVGTLSDVDVTTGIITPLTVELWNNNFTSAGVQKPDGGYVTDTDGIYPAAGVLDKIPRPSSATSTTIRSVFTDLGPTSGTLLSNSSGSGIPMLQIPKAGSATTSQVMGLFTGGSSQAPYNMTGTGNLINSLSMQIQLLNYLGYNIPVTSTALPAAASVAYQANPYQGGTIHSQPIQVTYSGTLDANGNLAAGRDESLLFGTMEGAIHLVTSSSTANATKLLGVEQMAFIPSEILTNTIAAQALVPNNSNSQNLPTTSAQILAKVVAPQHTYVVPLPSQGADGPWVADPIYTTTNNTTSGTISAKQMRVYGGLRMGGSSYYGLDLTSCTASSTCVPTFLFRIGPDQSAYSAMGQSWSKPVLANVRYGGNITRVMIIGGGYDLCYENPKFSVGASQTNDLPGCSGITTAAGNAVYVVNANTGALLWKFTKTCAGGNCSADTDMVDSVVMPIATLDRDGDKLIDHLYFADLGGKVYRADLNNTAGTATSAFGVRVVTLANLATTTTGAAVTAGDAPRFYEQPTLTFHTRGTNQFILVGIGSGDRSNPLDIVPSAYGGLGLTGRPRNKVYGIIDQDFANATLITGSPTLTAAMNISNMLSNPQTGGTAGGSLLTTDVGAQFMPGGGSYRGWYRSLSADYQGTEPGAAVYNTTTGLTTTTGKTAGGKKAYEKPYALTGNLVMPVYDPEGNSVPASAACSPRVVGETDYEVFGLPYGAYTNSSGIIDTSREQNSGAVAPLNADGTARSLIGPGIRGLPLVTPKSATTGAPNSCSSLAFSSSQSSKGLWQCTRKLVPTLWYEKQPNPTRVK